MKRSNVCALVVLLGWIAPQIAAAQTFEIEGEDGTICAAFAYAPRYVATAAHCTLAGQTYGLSIGGTASLVARGDFDARNRTESQRTAEDVALLKTSRALPRPARIATRDPRLGEVLRIYAPGSVFQDCIVSARMGDAFDLDCGVRAGWSGAPVFTKRRIGKPQLIGIVSGRVGDVSDRLAVMVHARVLQRLGR